MTDSHSPDATKGAETPTCATCIGDGLWIPPGGKSLVPCPECRATPSTGADTPDRIQRVIAAALAMNEADDAHTASSEVGRGPLFYDGVRARNEYVIAVHALCDVGSGHRAVRDWFVAAARAALRTPT